MKKYTVTIEMPDKELEDCQFCRFEHLNKIASPMTRHCLLDLDDKDPLCPLVEVMVDDD